MIDRLCDSQIIPQSLNIGPGLVTLMPELIPVLVQERGGQRIGLVPQPFHLVGEAGNQIRRGHHELDRDVGAPVVGR